MRQSSMLSKARQYIIRQLTFAAWLKAEFPTINWLKLNDERNLRSLIGGEGDILLAGSIVRLDSGYWLDADAYAGMGIGELAINDKTYMYQMILSSDDALGDGSVVATHRFYLNGTNYMYIYISGEGSVVFYYYANGVGNYIVIGSLIPNIQQVFMWTVDGAGGYAVMYINGLVFGQVQLTNNIVGTTLSTNDTAYGAINRSGGAPSSSYKRPIQVADGILSYRDIRAMSIKALGYDPFTHHNLYKVAGKGSGFLNLGTSYTETFEGTFTLDFWFTVPSYNASEVLFSIDGGNMYIQWVSQSGGSIKFQFAARWTGSTALWVTNDFVIVIGERHHLTITYNYANINADPIVWLDGVQLGLTESVSPSGGNRDFAGQEVHLLQYASGDLFQSVAEIESFAVFDTELNSSGIAALANGTQTADLSSHPAVANLISWLKCGDYIDATNFDHIDITGSGTFYDGSGNGNHATPVNMTNTNLIQVTD